MRSLLLLIPAAALLFGCGGPATTETSTPSAADTTAFNPGPSFVLDLDQHDLPLLVTIPGTGAEPTASLNEEMGYVEVRAGDHFNLVITEMKPDFARLKADLERDMLAKNTIVEETPDLLLYRSEFPDGAGSFVHYMQVLRSGDRTFVVEDKPEGQFTESEARAMIAAVSAKPAS